MIWKVLQRGSIPKMRFVIAGCTHVTSPSHPGILYGTHETTTGIWNFQIQTLRHFSVKPTDPKQPLREESTSNISATGTKLGPTDTTVEKVEKPGIRGMLKKYGLPFIIWYSSLYFTTGAIIYLSIESGLVGGGDILEWVRQTGFSPDIVDKINPKYGNIGAAIVLNECLEIARFPFAISTTPMIIKAWKKVSEKKNKTELK